MIKRSRIKQNLKELLPNLREIFKSQEGLIAAYLFGSYAKGTPGPLSDIDIAYLLNESMYKEKAEELGASLYLSVSSCLQTDEISFICLNEAPLSARYAVISTGKVLFSSDDSQRVEFEERTLKMYIDTQHIRQEYFDYLFKKIKEDNFGYRYKQNKKPAKSIR